MIKWYFPNKKEPPLNTELWVYADTEAGRGWWKGVYYQRNKESEPRWFTGAGETTVYLWAELTDEQPENPPDTLVSSISN